MGRGLSRQVRACTSAEKFSWREIERAIALALRHGRSLPDRVVASLALLHARRV